MLAVKVSVMSGERRRAASLCSLSGRPREAGVPGNCRTAGRQESDPDSGHHVPLCVSHPGTVCPGAQFLCEEGVSSLLLAFLFFLLW